MLLSVGVLRELFRHYQAFCALYETEGIDTIEDPGGEQWCLHDISYLVSQLHRLSPRQQQAISLCLLNNVKEKDAAVMMGVSETNPVAMYATLGIKKLIEMIEAGDLPRFRATDYMES